MPEEFCRRYWLDAQICEESTGVPALITMAQAALESGWGNKAGGYAFFGIKADKSWTGPVVLQDTQEVVNGRRVLFTAANDPEGRYRRFRAYASPEEAFADHAAFLRANHRYAPCFACGTSVAGWAQALQDCGYSTDNTTTDGTPTYAQTLLQVVRSVQKRIPA